MTLDCKRIIQALVVLTVMLAFYAHATPNVPTEAQVYLQLGSFLRANNAERFKHHIEQVLHKPVRIQSVAQEGKTLYKVQVGPLNDVTAAYQIHDQFERQVNLKPLPGKAIIRTESAPPVKPHKATLAKTKSQPTLVSEVTNKLQQWTQVNFTNAIQQYYQQAAKQLTQHAALLNAVKLAENTHTKTTLSDAHPTAAPKTINTTAKQKQTPVKTVTTTAAPKQTPIKTVKPATQKPVQLAAETSKPSQAPQT